jgi:hypothetical protein
MMISSRYLLRGASTTCAHCKKPFPVVNGHVEAWRTSVGGYFCNEFCAEDEEEAAFQDHRRASCLSTTPSCSIAPVLVRKGDLRLAKHPH